MPPCGTTRPMEDVLRHRGRLVTTTDVDAIKKASQDLNETMQKIGQAVYQQQPPPPEGETPPPEGEGGEGGKEGGEDEGTVEGEFREV